VPAIAAGAAGRAGEGAGPRLLKLVAAARPDSVGRLRRPRPLGRPGSPRPALHQPRSRRNTGPYALATSTDPEAGEHAAASEHAATGVEQIAGRPGGHPASRMRWQARPAGHDECDRSAHL